MASLNKVMLIGGLGRDPEVKYMQNGDAVANFSIATTESWKDKSGAKQERTEWHNIVMYRKLAEIAGEYLKKGSSVYIEGRLQTRKWQTKEGQDRYTTEIIADQMQMLGGKAQGSGGNDGGYDGQQQDGGQQSQSRPAQSSAPAQQNTAQTGGGSNGGYDFGDNDIPFGPPPRRALYSI